MDHEDGGGRSDRALILASTDGPSWSASRKTCRISPIVSSPGFPLRPDRVHVTNTLNRRAFSALSHAWNLGFAISDSAHALRRPPVSWQAGPRQSSGRNAACRTEAAPQIDRHRDLPQFLVSTSCPTNVACWQSVPVKSASIRVA